MKQGKSGEQTSPQKKKSTKIDNSLTQSHPPCVFNSKRHGDFRYAKWDFSRDIKRGPLCLRLARLYFNCRYIPPQFQQTHQSYKLEANKKNVYHKSIKFPVQSILSGEEKHVRWL